LYPFLVMSFMLYPYCYCFAFTMHLYLVFGYVLHFIATESNCGGHG
jgi:hypothetical protein